MEDPDADKPNAIHSTAGAKDYGYDGALVGGATAYGWAAATIVDALGEDWLNHGWAEVRFKRPIYPRDELLVSVDDDCELSVSKVVDATECFGGRVGLGDAPWLAELAHPPTTPAEPPADPRPVLTLPDAPIGHNLRTRAVAVSAEAANTYARTKERDSMACYYGDCPRVHPAWIAEQPIHWLHHSYEYGPAIHTSSHIQHLGVGVAGQTFEVAGICTDAYERKGHHYIVNDTGIRDATGCVVARVRHTAIFKVAKRS